jgi:hypothetical protein
MTADDLTAKPGECLVAMKIEYFRTTRKRKSFGGYPAKEMHSGNRQE